MRPGPSASASSGPIPSAGPASPGSTPTGPAPSDSAPSGPASTGPAPSAERGVTEIIRRRGRDKPAFGEGLGGGEERPGGLVVGLGAPDRGDDAVGSVVARHVATRVPPGVVVRVHEDPTDLVESMTGADVVVVVDAVRSPDAAPGELVVLETGAAAPPLPEDGWARTGRGGTHAFGLATAVELARALGRLPPRVAVVGVVGASFDHGAPLSPPVAAATGDAVEAVLAALHRSSS